MPVTIKEIAKRCGVAYQTVGRILGDHAHLHTPATVAKVRAAADAMGYRPSRFAKRMRTGRTGLIALVQDPDGIRSCLPASLVISLVQACEARGFHLLVTGFEDQRIADGPYLPTVLREIAADALLIGYHTSTPQHFEESLAASGVPAIWLNSERAEDCVRHEEFGAARQLTLELLRQGHRRIAYHDHWHHRSLVPSLHYSRRDHLAGYRAAMAEAGLPSNEIMAPADGPLPTISELIQRTLAGPDRPQALLAHELDVELLYMIRYVCGLRIPQDIAIAGFSLPAFASAIPTVYHHLTDWPRLGAEAVAMALEKLADPARKIPARVVPGIQRPVSHTMLPEPVTAS